jgi:predicted nicotinamide N-methyase
VWKQRSLVLQIAAAKIAAAEVVAAELAAAEVAAAELAAAQVVPAELAAAEVAVPGRSKRVRKEKNPEELSRSVNVRCDK